jgi:outer membrane protein
MRIRPVSRLACAAVASALVAGLGVPSAGFAQSLIESLSPTYNSNPDLLTARAVLRQTDETLSQALANWRPRVQFAAEYNRQQADSYSQIRAPTYYQLNGRIMQFTVIQPLFRGGQTVADTAAAKANIQAQRALLADAEQTVLLNAVTAYADLERDAGTVDARKSNVKVLQEQLTSTRERFRVGELTITDVSQAEARLASAVADLTLAEAQLRVSQAAYQRTVGQPPGQLGQIPFIGTLPTSEEETTTLAMAAGPRALSAQYRITAAQYGINSAVGVLLPQVNLVGFAQQQFDVSTPNDQFYNVGVRLQAVVPIYQNGSEWSRIRVAKQVLGQRRSELDSARRLAAETAIRAWRGLDSAKSRVTSFQAAVTANEVALNGVRQEALVGSRTTLDVLNAEQELLNAQVQLITAQHDVYVNYYAVLSAIGRLTARGLGLPVEYYDEEKYYNDVASRWIGDWSSDPGSNSIK